MGYIIVTTRNLLWMLLSLTAVMALVAGLITPKWLIGYPQTDPHRNITTSKESRPTIGLYNHCSRLALHSTSPWSCRRYVHGLNDLPSNFWKASLVFLVFGGAVACICVLMAMIGLCVQNIGKKSLFSVVGVIQAVAGLLLVIGLVLYPAGWGSENRMIEKYCYKSVSDDDKPSPFKLGECKIGWAFYSVLGGTLLVFLCAVFSGQAEKSTSSDRVQDEIFKGKRIICLP